MKRRELQALAKKNGVRANMKSVAIVAALEELFAEEQERLNKEAEAVALVEAGVDPATADVAMATEASFVDATASDAESVDGDAVDTIDVGITLVVENQEEPIAAVAADRVADADATVEAEAEVAAAKSASPAQAAPEEAKTKTTAQPRKSAKKSKGRKRKVKDWDAIHARMFAKQQSIVEYHARRTNKTPRKTPRKALDTSGKTPRDVRSTKQSTSRTTPAKPKPMCGGVVSKRTPTASAPSAAPTTRKTTPRVAVLSRKPFVPTKSSKRPTKPQAFHLGRPRATTPTVATPAQPAGTTATATATATATGATHGRARPRSAVSARPTPRSARVTPGSRIPKRHARPSTATGAGGKIPRRGGGGVAVGAGAKKRGRRPTPHPAATQLQRGKGAPVVAPMSAARRKSSVSGGGRFKRYTGKVVYHAETPSIFSPTPKPKKRRVFDLAASLKRPLGYTPHTMKKKGKKVSPGPVAQQPGNENKHPARGTKDKVRDWEGCDFVDFCFVVFLLPSPSLLDYNVVCVVCWWWCTLSPPSAPSSSRPSLAWVAHKLERPQLWPVLMMHAKRSSCNGGVVRFV